MHFNTALRLQFFGFAVGVFFLLSLIIVWPGTASFDSVWQWKQAMSGEFHEHHPPIMAWWWRFLFQNVLHEKGVLLLFHLLTFWSAIYILGITLGRTSWWLAYLTIAMALAPSVLSMTVVIWKDTGMVCTYLLATALILHATLHKKLLAGPTAILIGLLLFYGTGVRYNAMFALAPLCLLFAIGLVGRQRMREIFFLSAMLWITVTGSTLVFNRSITAVHSSISQQLFILQLAGMSTITQKPLMPESFLERHHLTHEQFMRTVNFNYHSAHIYPFIGGSSEEAHELGLALQSAIRDYPLEYLRYRIIMMQYILGWNVPTSWPYQWDNYNHWDEGNNKKIHIRQLIGSYFEWGANSFWFKPWVFLLGCFFFLYVGLRGITPQKPAHIEISILSASGICYILPYFLIGPSNDFRYTYWMLISCLVSLLLWACSLRAKPLLEPISEA